MFSLIEMLKYKRPEGSKTQEQFCDRFLKPVFGDPDSAGNYTKIVGDSPEIAFMSHHDTVHSHGGMQSVVIQDDAVTTTQDCLGADCTTGIYIMLRMIELGIPGVYVVHAAEELGCIGSSHIVGQYPLWLENVHIAISFDRWGTTSIITHQMGERTCSDAFARSLAKELKMSHELDTKGSFTDSNEYRGIISECTNLSVGYYHQHSKNEIQDLIYLEELINALEQVDWSNLVVSRTPTVEYDDSEFLRGWPREDSWGDDRMYQFIKDHPQFLADFLVSYGISVDDLEEEYYNQTFTRNVP